MVYDPNGNQYAQPVYQPPPQPVHQPNIQPVYQPQTAASYQPQVQPVYQPPILQPTQADNQPPAQAVIETNNQPVNQALLIEETTVETMTEPRIQPTEHNSIPLVDQPKAETSQTTTQPAE